MTTYGGPTPNDCFEIYFPNKINEGIMISIFDCLETCFPRRR
jgi:hypothetical protein